MTGGLPAIQTRKKMVKVICNQALDEMLVWRRPCLLSWCSLSSLTLGVEIQVLVQVNLCQKHLFSTNPQYDKRLFIDLPVQHMKTTSSEHVVYINYSECQNKNKKQFMYTTCSDLVIFMY